MIWKFAEEEGPWPAVAVAGEIKFPTARNRLVGTRKTDYAAYFVASHRYGDLDLHFNVGYTVFGKPSGADAPEIKNRPSVALAGIYKLNRQDILFGEVLNDALISSAEGNDGAAPEATTSQEGSTGETVGTLGYAHTFTNNVKLSFGVSYDNNSAVLFRPGIEYIFNW